MGVNTSQLSFEELHKKGAQDFPTIWLEANEQAMDFMEVHGVDPRNQENKKLVTALAYKFCEKRRHYYYDGVSAGKELAEKKGPDNETVLSILKGYSKKVTPEGFRCIPEEDFDEVAEDIEEKFHK